MIFGIGQDICDSKRIEATLNRFGDRFKFRIYTIQEIKKCDSRLNYVDSYARRFAAKEACSKALGTGFRLGVYWKNIEVVNEKSGKPSLKLTGGAYERLKKLTPIGSTHNISLSITDDFPWAQANVIIEVIKK